MIDVFINEMKKYPQLSNTETITLIKQGSLQNIDKIIKGNWKLVVKAVTRSIGCLSLEHVTTGMIALDYAAKTYDFKKGKVFSTYAYKIVTSQVKRTFNRERTTITLPYTIFEQKRTDRRYQQEINNALNGTYLAEAESDLQQNSVGRKSCKITYLSTMNNKNYNCGDLSEQEYALEKKMFRVKTNNFIEEGLSSTKEKKIFKCRIINGETIKEVSKKVGVTLQRVSQYEKQIYDKFKNFLEAKEDEG